MFVDFLFYVDTYVLQKHEYFTESVRLKIFGRFGSLSCPETFRVFFIDQGSASQHYFIKDQ